MARRRSIRRTPRSATAALRKLLAPPRLPTLPRTVRAVVPPVRASRRPGRWLRDAHVGPSGRRLFDVYVPAGRRRSRLPVVVLLHGCTQTAAEFVHATRFEAVADRNGLLLVVPHQEPRHHGQRCWRWYESANQRRGTGEPGAIAGIVADVLAERSRWRGDPERVYVAGLSAGGAMALVLAATYPDVFAAAGVHSAPPFRAATRADQALAVMAGRGTVPPALPGDTMAPVVVVQGTADVVVRSDNGERIVEQWLAHHSAAAADDPDRVLRTRATTGRAADGHGYTVRRWYTARGRAALEYWSIRGLGHAWSGGRDGASFSDAAGPRAATVMWTFFRRHRLDRGAASPSAGRSPA